MLLFGGFLVLVLPDAGVMLVQVLLPVGIDALGVLLRVQRQRPTLPLEVGIFKGGFAFMRPLHHIHTGTDAAPCTADGEVAGMVDDVVIVVHNGVAAGLAAPFCAGQRVRKDVGFLLVIWLFRTSNAILGNSFFRKGEHSLFIPWWERVHLPICTSPYQICFSPKST